MNMVLLLFVSINLLKDSLFFYKKNVVKMSLKHGEIAYTVAPKEYNVNPRLQLGEIPYTEFFWNFEQEERWGDLARNYKSEYISYMPINSVKRCIKGNSCGFFYLPEHRLNFFRKHFLDSKQSFTVEIWIKPIKYRKRSDLVKNVCALNGRLYGYTLELERGFIKGTFYNFFMSPSGELLPTLEVKSANRLAINKWHHIALGYDRDSESIFLIVDGKSVRKVRLDQRGTGFLAYRNKYCRSGLSIGEGFFGFIDDIRITNASVNSLKKNFDFVYRRYPDNLSVIRGLLQSGKRRDFSSFSYIRYKGILKSKVFSTKYYNTLYKRIEVNSISGNGTYINFYFRSSNFPFREDSIYPKWKLVYNLNSRNFAAGKYFQWMAVFYPSEDGKRAPFLKDLKISYSLDEPPLPPREVKAFYIGKGKIKISWIPNIEKDLGGYTIYYGYSKELLLGKIVFIRGRIIDNRYYNPKTKRIEVVIDNSIVKENFLRLKALGEEVKYTNPLFIPNNQYVFFVSAYDSFTKDKSSLYPKDYSFIPSESGLSNGAYVRFRVDDIY